MLSPLTLYSIAQDCRPSTGQSEATVDPWTGEVLDPAEVFDSEDWLVSVESHEEACHPQRLLVHITEWINSGAVEFACKQALYVGLWWENPDYLVLDLSAAINGQEEAEEFGRANRQRAIYRPSTGEYKALTGELVAAA